MAGTFFGLHGTNDATRECHKTIAEWLANGRLPEHSPAEITIQELVARWVFAEKYYAAATGKPTTKIGNILTALRMIVMPMDIHQQWSLAPGG